MADGPGDRAPNGPADLSRRDLWRQAPRTEILTAVVLGDLRWSDDPFVSDSETMPGAEELAALLRHHLEVGLLSRDSADLPYGGRPVLSDELVAVADPVKLGPVFAALSAPRPQDRVEAWWDAAARTVPRMVVRTLVQDLFGSGILGQRDPSDVWTLISSQHLAYARAARASLDVLADQLAPSEWDELGSLVGRTTRTNFQEALRAVVVR